MTKNLGKFNDFTQLIRSLGYQRKNASNSAALHELIILIRDKQDKCLEKVWPVAYELFCPGMDLKDLLKI
jgi:hypothetical protein